jgi:putative ABC transport system permease protein
MISNYLKIVARNLFKSPVFSAINITGLALGFSCGIFILLWVTDELKFDKFHVNGDRIYKVMENQTYSADGNIETQVATPGLLAQALKDEFPEIELATNGTWDVDLLVAVGDESMKKTAKYVEPDFLKIFSFPLIKGDVSTALLDPKAMVISESMAKQFFGDEDPINQTIRINNETDHNVTGVFKDIPRNSSIKVDFFMPYETWLKQNDWAKDFGNTGPRAWVMLRAGSNVDDVNAKIQDFLTKRLHLTGPGFTHLFLQKYSDAYLYSHFKDGKIDGGRIDYVKSFSIVAVVVLLIACINFMNMATAQSLRRAKEIGIRKVNGAARRMLIIQFLGEAFAFVFIGTAFALLLVELLLPTFRTLTDKQIFLPYTDPKFVGILVSVALLTGFVSGIYPAFFLSSFSIVKVLKGKFTQQAGSVSLRKVLVVVQFCFTITLIFATIVVYRQMGYIREKNLGFDRENMIIIDLEGDLKKKSDVLLTEVAKLPGVHSATKSTSSPLIGGNSTVAVEWPGKGPDDKILFTQMATGYDYVETMKLTLIDGRDFIRDPSDSNSYIINEETARRMNLKDPVGQEITFWGRKGKIVGLVKDYHLNSLHTPIEPVILHRHPDWSNLMIVRTEARATTEALDGLSKLCKQLNPAYPFNYQFVDDIFESQYKSEAVISKLANYFSSMAIFISCLGLLGLIVHTAEQRVKEFGIRKVLGASVRSILMLLAKDFVLLVTIAFTISSPFAWYLMNNWLLNFAYPAQIDWRVFAISGISALAIALITVTTQALRVAIKNPVDTLRSE